MKRVLILTLIATLSLFALTACNGLVPAEGEGEGEGEVITEGVTVDIKDALDIEGRTYLSRGEHEITVTFPSSVAGVVKGYITYCTGDYSKAGLEEGTEVVLFPNTDRTVWTGSGSFRDSASLCCASYLQITSGECEDDVCINMPVIVDSSPPYAVIEVCLDDCDCGGCELSFTSTTTQLPCSDTVNCGDDCSGLAGWSIALYEKYPYNECCEIPCEEPIDTCSGSECPIECTTDCLMEGTYYAVLTLSDAVGNEVTFGTRIDWDTQACDTLYLTKLFFQNDPYDCLDDPYNCGFTVCADKAGYRLSVLASPPEGGNATDQTGQEAYMAGDSASILAEPATGYEFVNWSAPSGTFADDLSASTIFSMPDEDVTVVANFGHIFDLPFAEDFAGVALGTIPAYWNTTHIDNWNVEGTNYAGGIAPEIYFSWSPSFADTSRLISPYIDASGASGLTLSFKHHVDHYATPYTLKVQVSTDGGTTWSDSWSISPLGDIGPETVLIGLSAYDGQIIKIAWVFEGDSFNIDYWYIDDIVVN